MICLKILLLESLIADSTSLSPFESAIVPYLGKDGGCGFADHSEGLPLLAVFIVLSVLAFAWRKARIYTIFLMILVLGFSVNSLQAQENEEDDEGAPLLFEEELEKTYKLVKNRSTRRALKELGEKIKIAEKDKDLEELSLLKEQFQNLSEKLKQTEGL